MSNLHYKIVKLETAAEMAAMHSLIKELTPDISFDEYIKLLELMVPHNYRQVAVYDTEKIAGVSGYWICAKIYSGKYIEIDNLVVASAYRSKGIGKLLVDWMLEEGKKQGCRTALLDAYVENFKAHKFYYREGFIARGFHYLKKL
jgi:GNAT superfamily N-acetyltransferase